jgi:hypothetical protein
MTSRLKYLILSVIASLALWAVLIVAGYGLWQVAWSIYLAAGGG